MTRGHGQMERGLTGAGAAALKADDHRIVVIGAGGWLGLATLELLHRLLGARAFAARVVAIGSSERVLNLRAGLTVAQRPLRVLCHLPRAPSWVLHLAFLTQEKAKAMSDDDYVAANRAISGQVLRALDRIGADGVFVPSSGAVYKVDDPEAPASMRLYGRLKLEDEAAFGDWAEARGKRAVIARVFNLSGPYINKQSSYALACFIKDALAGRPIEIKAAWPVYRSYLAISELMSVAFGVLTDGDHGSVLFDAAGDREYEMGEIAATVAAVLAAKQGPRRQMMTAQNQDRYIGDNATFTGLRRRFAVDPVDFSSQIITTGRFIEDVSGAPA